MITHISWVALTLTVGTNLLRIGRYHSRGVPIDFDVDNH